jgi:hypothetical protein
MRRLPYAGRPMEAATGSRVTSQHLPLRNMFRVWYYPVVLAEACASASAR